MSIPRLSTAVSVCILSLASLFPVLAQEEGKRYALIIGNNNYPVSPLRNAINDARLMDKALKSAGFITIEREDVTQESMEKAIAEFVGHLGPEDTALFFYAGHGVQIESENFLVPVDFEPAGSVIQAKFRCFKVGLLLEELKNRPKRSIVILDACRSNPVAQAHSLEAGLAQPQNAGKETYIAFSTGPGQVAADNPAGRDSWFTEALAELIDQPSLTLDDVFTRVKARVANETEKRQSPWTISSLSSTFYFHQPSNLKTENDPTLAEKWMLDAQRREQRQEWAEAITLVDQVLKRKPGGSLEAMAATRLPYLKARQDAQSKYDDGDFKTAASLYEQSLGLDPFAIDAAFEAVNSFLLADDVSNAVRLLSTVRVRGSAPSAERANAMLKEIAAVYPEAGETIKAGIPAPPPIQQMFGAIRFDVPDWEAGLRFVRTLPVQYGSSIKALEAAYPPPPDPAEATQTASAAGGKDFFHVEIAPTGETRDLSIRRLREPGSAGPSGTLLLDGSDPVAVVLNGEVVARTLPYQTTLPPGKYRVETVQQGKILSSTEVEILASEKKTIGISGRP